MAEKKEKQYVSDNAQQQEYYTYSVKGISSQSRWIFIGCNEEDPLWDISPFSNLVKKAAKIHNGEILADNILLADNTRDDTRYKIKNDPLHMIFQYDTLFGIVLEYALDVGLENTLKYLREVLNIEIPQNIGTE